MDSRKVKLSAFVDSLASDSGLKNAAREFFISHSIVSEYPFLEKQVFAEHKASQAEWFFALASIKNSECKKIGFTSKAELFAFAITVLNELSTQNEWHAWKCNSMLALRKRLSPFKSLEVGKATMIVALETLLSKKVHNTNALKIGIEQQAVIINIFADGTGKSFAQAYADYMKRVAIMIELKIWRPDESEISESTFSAFLNKPTVRKVWWASRRDSKRLHGHLI